MPSTPLGTIEYPAAGDTDWYEESESGLEEWLARAELLGIPTYDSFSDLPTAGSTKTVSASTTQTQRQFAAVADEKTVYRDDGSAWQPWMGQNLDRVRTAEEPVVNVKAYGAVGDGVTDDTAAIVEAKNAAPAGAEIWHPPGDYAITSEVYFGKDDLKLTGPATIVADAAIDNPMYRVVGDDVKIQDLEFDAQNNARIGVYSGGHRHTIERCVARNLTHDTNAVYGFGTGNEDVTYRDCEVYDADSATSGVIVRGFRGSNTAARLKMDNCIVKRIGAVDDADGVKAGGPESEILYSQFIDCEKRAIKVDNGGDRSKVIGNICYWTEGTGGMLAPRRCGIQLQTADETVKHNHIEADHYNSGAGVVDNVADGAIVSENTIVVRDGTNGTSTNCISTSQDTTIVNNILDAGVDANSAIRIRPECSDNTIMGNTIYGTPSVGGIVLHENSGVFSTNVSIVGGTIREASTGIEVQDADNVKVTGVTFADSVGTNINDPNGGLTFPITKMWNSVAQTFSSGTGTRLELDSTSRDGLGASDLTNNQFVPQESGVYQFDVTIMFKDWVGGNYCMLAIDSDTRGRLSEVFKFQPGSSWHSFEIQADLWVDAGEPIYAMINQTTGSSQDSHGAEARTYMSVTKVE